MKKIVSTCRFLTKEEFALAGRKTSAYGEKMVEGLDDMAIAYDIIIDHRQRWEGSGYPAGKK